MAETDQVSLYAFRINDPTVFFLSPWEFVQYWKPHRLRPPSNKYKLTQWIETPDDAQKGARADNPVPGVDYELNEDEIKKHGYLLMYPTRKDLEPATASGKAYELFRQTWILFKRSRPVVPCPELTPLPSRRDSKEKRAKIFSIYLRPWTMLKEFATEEVHLLGDLGAPSFRHNWKTYLSNVLPTSERQIRNFMLATLAEGRQFDDDEANEGRGRMPGVTCSITPEDVQKMLDDSVQKKSLLSEETTEDAANLQNRRLHNATEASSALAKLQYQTLSKRNGKVTKLIAQGLHVPEEKSGEEKKRPPEDEENLSNEMVV